MTSIICQGVGNAYLNFFYKTNGYIPQGNIKSSRMSTIQVGLTPNFYDQYYDLSYNSIKKILDNHRYVWNKETNKLRDYALTFYLITKKGTETLRVKGPSKSHKQNLIDYSIFLPDQIKDINLYIDLVFEGMGIVLAEYDVPENEVIKIRDECKKELGLT